MFPSAHQDTFARDNLPPAEAQPQFLLARPELHYPPRLNIATALVDAHVAAGRGGNVCLITPTETLTYAQFAERVNRLANVLTRDYGLVPGERVLIRAANTIMLVALMFATFKAGGIAIATMPLLRAREIVWPLRKAAVQIALCDVRLAADFEPAVADAPGLRHAKLWGTGGADGLEALMMQAGYEHFEACDTAQDDVCLIAFTSGTTGEPKGTMHYHRDMLAICDAYAGNILRAQESDRFIGSPPLAFTFGLGGLVLFPFRVGASAVLLENAAPGNLASAIAHHKPTICFTSPTAYRAMLNGAHVADLASLRKCVSAGEALPLATFEAWKQATGLPLMDGIGATEMLHIFIAAPEEAIRPGATGLPVPGYEARVVDESGRDCAANEIGKLAVRGPTGCRYLADARQTTYVRDGWNYTGDSYRRDADGYFWYEARSDDMIVSSGYNIAGPEVEMALAAHPSVADSGVVGMPDTERGMVVKAYVMLKEGHTPSAALAAELQNFCKAEIAPYKYPRVIAFVADLPRTQTGKLQRFELRARAAREAVAAIGQSQ